MDPTKWGYGSYLVSDCIHLRAKLVTNHTIWGSRGYYVIYSSIHLPIKLGIIKIFPSNNKLGLTWARAMAIFTLQGQQKQFSLANMALSLQQGQYDGNETQFDPSRIVPFLLGMSWMYTVESHLGTLCRYYETKRTKQAGAELCQAQAQLLLA